MIVSGADLKKVKDYGDRVLDWVRNTPGAMEADMSYKEGNPEIKIEVDRLKMSELGLNLQVVGATMQTAFAEIPTQNLEMVTLSMT